jgi:hypothetical protein
MRPMRVDRVSFMLGERAELPALQGGLATGETRCPGTAQCLTLNFRLIARVVIHKTTQCVLYMTPSQNVRTEITVLQSLG